MIQKGWTWLVLPHYVEEAHPELADLVQKALNASNSIYGTQGEMELASSIMICVIEHGGKIDDWEQLSFDLWKGHNSKRMACTRQLQSLRGCFQAQGLYIVCVLIGFLTLLQKYLFSHVT